MSQNFLFRGGQKIELQKEPEFFTAILPSKTNAQELNEIKEVQEIKQVFHNVFKIRSLDYQQEDLMKNLRGNSQMQCVVHHAYNPVGDKNTRYYLTDMVAVKFQAGTTTTKIEEILASHGLKLMKQYPHLKDTYLFKVTKSAGKNPVKVTIDLNERAEVVYAEPNLINRFQNFYTPTDSLFANQWHLKAENGIEVIAGADVDATSAWDITRGSRDVIVAIIDDGIDLTHPDFKGDRKVVFPRDYVDNDSLPLPTRDHGDFHGTPVAGVAIGEENGTGIVGAAPRCALMPIRFDLAADDNMLFEMFEFAGRRAHILSNSWGPVPVNAPLPTFLYDQLTDLYENGGPDGKGCLVLFAAGNYNAPINDPDNRNFIWLHPNRGLVRTTGPIINGHAAHPSTMAVSASTSQNRKSAYSNWGNEINFAAPSDNWNPLDPQERLPGRGIWTTDNESSGFGFEPGSRYTGNFGGTSSACPLAAGVAALVKSVNPDLTAKQIRAILEETADKIVDENPDPVLNQTLGTYDQNGHSEWFGFGKLNAFKAVKKAMELKPTDPTEENPDPDSTEATNGVSILAALVNPHGRDTGKETVSLYNAMDVPANLNGWQLKDSRDRVDILADLTIGAGAMAVVPLVNVRLPNNGGLIQLLDNQGNQVEEVKYDAQDTTKKGWQVKF